MCVYLVVFDFFIYLFILGYRYRTVQERWAAVR